MGLAVQAQDDDAIKVIKRNNFLSPAQKLKVFMQACRTDSTKKQ